MRGREADCREILFEMTRVGNVVRVAAIDPASGIEAIVIAPAHADLGGARRLASRKLALLLARRRQGG